MRHSARCARAADHPAGRGAGVLRRQRAHAPAGGVLAAAGGRLGAGHAAARAQLPQQPSARAGLLLAAAVRRGAAVAAVAPVPRGLDVRSEEHTSELQSLMRISYAVFCLKKKKTINSIKTL